MFLTKNLNKESIINYKGERKKVNDPIMNGIKALVGISETKLFLFFSKSLNSLSLLDHS